MGEEEKRKIPSVQDGTNLLRRSSWTGVERSDWTLARFDQFIVKVCSFYSPKESSFKNSSSGSYCFWRDFTCFMVRNFWHLYDLWLYCGGWVVVVVVSILPYAVPTWELGFLPNFLWVTKPKLHSDWKFEGGKFFPIICIKVRIIQNRKK